MWQALGPCSHLVGDAVELETIRQEVGPRDYRPYKREPRGGQQDHRPRRDHPPRGLPASRHARGSKHGKRRNMLALFRLGGEGSAASNRAPRLSQGHASMLGRARFKGHASLQETSQQDQARAVPCAVAVVWTPWTDDATNCATAPNPPLRVITVAEAVLQAANAQTSTATPLGGRGKLRRTRQQKHRCLVCFLAEVSASPRLRWARRPIGAFRH